MVKDVKEVPYTPLFALVKIIDIGFVTVYFFVFGIAVAKLFDYAYGVFDEKDYKKVSKFQLVLEILVHLFAIAVVAYILRNIVSAIPFPLEGVAGFEHERLREIHGGEIIGVILLFFQKNLHDKINYFVTEVFGFQHGNAEHTISM